MSTLCPFHLAIPVNDIDETEQFYVGTLGCRVGRRDTRWIDFDFFGHQVSAHLVDDTMDRIATNPVDGENVPARHFGIVLEWDDWHALSQRLQDRGMDFLISPTVRFKGQPGEQATLFIQDPSGNALEFKSLRSREQLFATE